MIKKVNKDTEKIYLVRIQPRDKVTGSRVTVPVQYAKNKTQARKIEKRMWQEYKSGLNLGEGGVVFADEFQKYVDRRSKSISPVTLRSWQASAESFKKFFKKAKINQITTQLVSDYAHAYVSKHETAVSKSSTISKRLVHMRNFFKSIVGSTIKDNPVPESPLKVFFRQSDFSLPKEWRILSKEELSKIQNSIIKDLPNASIIGWGSRLAVLVESYTGMRVGELQALKFSNIVTENGVTTFRINNSWSDYLKDYNGSLKARPKGYSRSVLPVPTKVVDLIKTYKLKQDEWLKDKKIENESNLIFLNLHDFKNAYLNYPIGQKGMNEMFKKYCRDLNINNDGKRLSLYSFRHSICTHLANVPGMSYTWAAEKMGHSLKMFMTTYVGVDPSIEQKMLDLWIN